MKALILAAGYATRLYPLTLTTPKHLLEIGGRPMIEWVLDRLDPLDGLDAVVPAGQYFVLGDNRPNSRDSHLGWFVPAENLVGRAWLSYWPPASWGVMPGVAYADR